MFEGATIKIPSFVSSSTIDHVFCQVAHGETDGPKLAALCVGRFHRRRRADWRPEHQDRAHSRGAEEGRRKSYALAVLETVVVGSIVVVSGGLERLRRPASRPRGRGHDRRSAAWMTDRTLISEAITVALPGPDRTPRRRPRSVIVVNPEAVEQARERDAERRSGRLRGPLHGIPVCSRTTSSRPTRCRPPPGRSRWSATSPDGTPGGRRLRAAGAIILGKTNLSEWANFRSERSASGWSGVGGQTRNPYDPSRSPCGSSPVQASRWRPDPPVAIGTETDGSVVCPANTDGLVGDQADRRACQPLRCRADLRHARTPPARWRARWPTPSSPSRQ